MTASRPTPEDFAGLVAVATGPLNAQAACAALDAVVTRLYSPRLFTILRFIRSEKASERLYSSNLAVYPLRGRKATPDTVWGRIVLDEGSVLVSRDREDVRANFSDFETIFALGVDSMINVPLMWDGVPIGSVNISFAGEDYQEALHDDLRALVGIVAPVIAATSND